MWGGGAAVVPRTDGYAINHCFWKLFYAVGNGLHGQSKFICMVTECLFASVHQQHLHRFSNHHHLLYGYAHQLLRHGGRIKLHHSDRDARMRGDGSACVYADGYAIHDYPRRFYHTCGELYQQPHIMELVKRHFQHKPDRGGRQCYSDSDHQL